MKMTLKIKMIILFMGEVIFPNVFTYSRGIISLCLFYRPHINLTKNVRKYLICQKIKHVQSFPYPGLVHALCVDMVNECLSDQTCGKVLKEKTIILRMKEYLFWPPGMWPWSW